MDGRETHRWYSDKADEHRTRGPKPSDRVVRPDRSRKGRREHLLKLISTQEFRITTWTAQKGSDVDTQGRADRIISEATSERNRLMQQLESLD